MTPEATGRWEAFKSWYQANGGPSWTYVKKCIPRTHEYLVGPLCHGCTISAESMPAETILEWTTPEELKDFVDAVTPKSIGDSGFFSSAIRYYVVWLKHVSECKTAWVDVEWPADKCKRVYQNIIKKGWSVPDLPDVVTLKLDEDEDEDDAEEMPFVNECQKLLGRNGQLILTGAPGTGKTYLAKKLAGALTDDTWTGGAMSHMTFVQFHPSYDYSDFVEGLRPYEKDGQIGFRRTDGAFMKLCRAAACDPDKEQNYVIVIDEINRGNLSKIFGELFYSIERDYRGEKGRVRTRYNDLLPEDDVFKDGFYVPENVYIVGTMNDVDRGVESIDFAIRRRFAWREVLPEERFDAMMSDIGKGVAWVPKAKGVMSALNAKICSSDILGSAYCIGPAYFRKLQEYEGDFSKLWDCSLKLLFKEYTRGMAEGPQAIEELKKLYYEKSALTVESVPETSAEVTEEDDGDEGHDSTKSI